MELTEELESMAESDSTRRRRIRSKSSFTLALLGWLLGPETQLVVAFGGSVQIP